MASLKDTIAKTGGGIFETTSDATSSAGRPASPTSPLGAKQLGLGPDQVKMAGSSASKSTALRDSAETLSLRDTIRKEQAETGTTEAEKAKAAKAGVVKAFSGRLEDRLDSIASQIAAGGPLTQAAPPLVAGVDKQLVAKAMPNLAATEVEALTNNINTLMAGTSTDKMTAIKDVATKLNLAPPTNEAGIPAFIEQFEATIAKMMPDKAATISKVAADAVRDYDKLTVEDLLAEGGTEAQNLLGDPGVLAETLGIPLEDLKRLNLPALKSKLEEIGAKDFSYIKELQRKAADPYTSEAERTSIIREMRRLGASGVRATEQDYNKTLEAVKGAEKVTVDGQEMTLEEALSNDRISAQVLAYLEGDDKFRQEFTGRNPGLASLIESNSAVLKDASTKLSDEVKAAAKAATDVQAMATIGKHTLSNATLKALIPEAGTFGATASEDSKKIVENIKAQGEGFAAWVDTAISTGSVNVDDLKMILGQDKALVSRFISNPNQMKDWLAFTKNLNAKVDSDPFGAAGFASPYEAEQFIRQFKSLSARDSGYFPGIENAIPGIENARALYDTLDANNDGILDVDQGLSREDLSKKLKSTLGHLANREATQGLSGEKFNDPVTLAKQSTQSLRERVNAADIAKAKKANEAAQAAAEKKKTEQAAAQEKDKATAAAQAEKDRELVARYSGRDSTLTPEEVARAKYAIEEMRKRDKEARATKQTSTRKTTEEEAIKQAKGRRA